MAVTRTISDDGNCTHTIATMKVVFCCLTALVLVPSSYAFSSGIPTRRSFALSVSSQAAESSSATSEEDPLGLTPELAKITNAFAMVGDDKLRHKQLLYMANQLAPLENPEAVMIPENKVPGCLSTVYVDAKANYDADKDEYLIDYVGECDGLLTKGLVALLVRGLSGNTAEAIQKINPEFIKKAGISASLTPGRNNGFLNMMVVMKKKALEAQAAADEDATGVVEEEVGEPISLDGDRPMYNGMIEALQKLQPTHLELVDNSDQHAGHAGSKGFNGESHFELDIVAPAFEGLSLVKRHQLIYMMLGDIMSKIHALQITRAKTPDEL